MPTSPWSLISRLRSGDDAKAYAALDELCKAYHYPLYCFLRHKGVPHHDAEDVLQGFLEKLIRLDSLATADAEKGRLRSFLLVCLQRHLSNWRRAEAQEPTSLGTDVLTLLAKAEARYATEATHHTESPDKLYDRQWACQIVSQAMERLRHQYEERGKRIVFEVLRPVLLAGGTLRDEDTSGLAAAAGMKSGALRVALLRLLRDYQAALRTEILSTVEDPAVAKEEFLMLLAAFRR